MVSFETNLISKKSGKFEKDRLNYLFGREFEWKKPSDANDVHPQKPPPFSQNNIRPMTPQRHMNTTPIKETHTNRDHTEALNHKIIQTIFPRE